MNDFRSRFEQNGGMYQNLNEESVLQIGGSSKKNKDVSPTSENWKKKYLEIKMENDNLKKENKKLKIKIKHIEKK